MKLATIKDGSRDGQLAVVSRDLKRAHMADAIAPTLQAALDDWAFIAPQLDSLYAQLNGGTPTNATRRAFDFDPLRCMAPLPRAYGLASGGAYLHLLELAWRARGAALPDALREAPLLAQGAGEDLLGPHDEIVLAHEEWGIDFGAGLAAIVDDVALGATPDDAHGRIRLLLLTNEIALRTLGSDDPAANPDAVLARPATACAPVAVTPDELGESWQAGKLRLPLRVSWNGNLVGQLDAGADMAFNFPQLIAHLSRSRRLRAGSIVGSGVVSNRDDLKRRSAGGYACIAEQRWRETLAEGAPVTPYLRFGDTVRIEMLDEGGKSLFGAIEQGLRKAQ